MASGLGTTHRNTAYHPGRQVSRSDHDARVTGPGLQPSSIDPRLGNFERRLRAVQSGMAQGTNRITGRQVD